MAWPLWSLLKRNTTLVRPGLLSQAVVYGSNIIGLSYYLKHSAFLKYYKEKSELHGVFGSDEPADELHDMLNNIISKDLKEIVSENTPIALYLTPGLQTTHIGTLGTWSGGFVGVPAFYEFKKEQDAIDTILVKTVRFDVTKGQEKELCDCFLLSDKAKKYGIAREILLLNSLQVYINAFLPFGVSFAVVFLYNAMQESYHILRYPLYIRGLIYVAFALFGLVFWRALYKNILQFYESEVEEKLAELGSEYLDGGIEYCTKELKRNSLPVEIKDQKLRILKAIDDFICKLTPSGIPLRVRLQYLETYLKEINKSVES